MHNTVRIKEDLIQVLKQLHGKDISSEQTNLLWTQLKEVLLSITNKKGHVIEETYWTELRQTLKALSHSQRSESDPFFTYASVYDEVIGKPCLEGFMANYIDFVFSRYGINPEKIRFLSIGCGTGIVEEYIMKRYGIGHDRLLGIDISRAMVEAAKRRIPAVCADFLSVKLNDYWDVLFQGLNVFQYLHHTELKRAVQKTAQMLNPGGIFFGDFITPDHFRCYPNVLFSDMVISLRQPRIFRINNQLYQESEIINISRFGGRLRVTYEGRHKRHLPPISKLWELFREIFKTEPEIFDPFTGEFLIPDVQTTASTRYVLVVRKA